MLAVNRRGNVIIEDVRQQVLEAGDCLVSHSTWRDLSEVHKGRTFIVDFEFLRNPAVDPQAVIVVTVLVVVAGSLAGLAPAVRAAPSSSAGP